MQRFYMIVSLLLISTFSFSQSYQFDAVETKRDLKELNDMFRSFNIYQLDAKPLESDIQRNSGGQIEFLFEHDLDWKLSLTPNDIISANFKGASTSSNKGLSYGDNITFNGQCLHPDGKGAALTVWEDFIYGFVNIADERFFIEPAQYILQGAPSDWYLVYSEKDVIDRGATCAAHDLEENRPQEPILSEAGSRTDCRVLEIAIASDFSMFSKYGSIPAIDAHNFGVLNNVQTNYDNEFNHEIQFEVVTTFRVDCNGCDPWSASNQAGTLLNSFRSWGNAGGFGVNFDLGQLWTDRNIASGSNTGVIGVAYINGICNNNKYQLLEDFTSNANLLRVLVAHEMGHNFGSGHDAAGSGFIMAPSVNNTNSWSANSTTVISNRIDFLIGTGCLSSCMAAIPPTADFSSDVQQGCIPQVVNFMDLSDGFPSSWNWTFPGGTPSSSTDQNPQITYNNAGIFPVTLQVSNSAGSDAVTINDYIEVAVNPFANFSFVSSDWTVVFQDLSTPADTYFWDFGDGNFSADQNPFHIYAQDGVYSVTLEIQNICGTSSITQDVVIVTDPIANFTADQTSGCAPLEVFFQDLSSSNTTDWNWTFVGGSPATSTVQYPLVTYDAPGVYDVLLEVSNDAGVSFHSELAYITVDPNPTSGFSATVADAMVTLVNNSTNANSYLWDFGDSNTSTDISPTHSYTTDGTYIISLTAYNACGENVSTQEVVISTIPVAGIQADAVSGCVDFEVNFSSTSQGVVDSYFWTIPGGTPATSTDANPTVLYTSPGVYSVTLEVTNSNGSDSETLVDFISVGTTVPAGFNSSINGTIVNFTPDNSSADSYLWDFGDGNSSNDISPSHDYLTDGTYTAILTTTTSCGQEMDSFTFDIVTLPSANFSMNETTGCAPFTVEFTSQSSANVDDWSWTFEGGSPSASTDENPVVTYSQAGTYDVVLTVSNEAGSDVFTIEDAVTVETIPSLNITYSENGQEVTFSSNANNADSFAWNFGDGNTSTNENPVHTYSTEDVFTVSLTVENGCGENTDTEIINLTTTPVAGIGTSIVSDVCIGETVQFESNSTGTITNWAWTFPGGNPSSSNDENPLVQYDNPGTYDVTLTVSNSNESNTQTLTNFVTVGQAPVSNFTFSENGLVVDFNSTASNADSYAWNFGDGNTSASENPTHAFAEENVYNVELTVTNDCGEDTYQLEIDLTVQPEASYTFSSATGCVPFEVQFSDNSSGTVSFWNWTFPGGTPASSTEQNPTVTYNAPGEYDVILEVGNVTQTDIIESTNVIIVEEGPSASFSHNVDGLFVEFNETASNENTYLWDFGDGNSSTEASPSHTYSAGGAYNVLLTVENDCGQDQFQIELVLETVPVAEFSVSSASGCAPFEISFNDNSSGNVDFWNWSFPGGTPSSSNEANPLVTYASAGSYDVSLEVGNASGTNAITQTDVITVGEGPGVDFSFAIDFLTVDFSQEATNAQTYSWDFGDGSSSSDANPTHTYQVDGIYQVLLTVTNDCGTNEVQQTVNLTSQPLANVMINGEDSGCPGLTVSFADNSSGTVTDWNWTFPGGTPMQSSEQNPVVTYNQPGVYDVSLTVSSAAGSDDVVLQNAISIGNTPTASFTVNNQSPNFSFTNGSSNGDVYLWDFGDGTTSNETNPSHTFLEDGEYEVSLTATNVCGSSVVAQTIVVVTPPLAFFEAVEPTGCPGMMVQMIDQSLGNVDTWSWSFPGGSPETSSEQNPIVTYNNSGTFDVFLTVGNAAGEVSTSRLGYVEINTLPDVDFTFNQMDNQVSFSQLAGNFTSLEWSFGDGSNSTLNNPTHVYAQNGSYEVILSAENECGVSTSSQTIQIDNVVLPSADFNIGSAVGCAPFETSFSNTSSNNASSWSWTFEGGTPSSFDGVDPPMILYNTPGVYVVELIVSNGEGNDTLSQTITAQSLPGVDFEVSQNAFEVNFTSPNDLHTTYSWDFGDGNMSAESNPLHVYSNEGSYEVTMEASNACGTVSGTTMINVEEGAVAPIVEFDVNVEAGCAPLEAQFMDASANEPTAWSWTFEGGTPATSTEQNPVVTFNSPGIFEVSLTASNDAGSNTATKVGFISVIPEPIANFDFENVGNGSVQFTNESVFGTNFSWDFGDGNSSSDENPTNIYTTSGIYNVMLTVSNECGQVEISQEIEIVISSTTGIAGISGIEVFPNPSKGKYTVNILTEEELDLQYKIFNILGETILSGSTEFINSEQFVLDLEGESSGSYLLMFSNGKQFMYKKLVLTK